MGNLYLFTEYPDVLTVEQVKEMLGIGKIGVYKLLKSGAIQSVMIGRQYRIPKLGVISYLTKEKFW